MVNNCLKWSACRLAAWVMLVQAAGCSVFAHGDVNRIGGHRFEVFHADRFTSKSYDRIEIGFRVYGDGDERSRASFDQAFNGRMRVVDSAGHTFPVLVQPMKWTDAHYSPLRGYLGIVKLGGRNAPTQQRRSMTSASSSRLLTLRIAPLGSKFASDSEAASPKNQNLVTTSSARQISSVAWS
jgi:hypothetical protein